MIDAAPRKTQLVSFASECKKSEIVPIELIKDDWFVRLIRACWPKQRSVIGMTVHRGQPPTTLISSGNLYEALYGREMEEV